MKGLIVGASSGIGAATLAMLEPSEWEAPDRTGLDVANPMDWRLYFRDSEEPYTHIVYSAGVNYLEWLGKGDLRRHESVVDTNLLGFIYMLEELKRYQSTPARVVVVGSDAADRPMRTSISYCASKAGLHMAVRVAARELGPQGWRINCVAPGMTDHTGMQEYVDARVADVRGWTEEHMRKYEEQQAVIPGRIQPNEVAKMICDVLQGPDHLNGSIITINGGR